MSGDEYRVIEGSHLGHGCCFDATVMDSRDNVICECLTMEVAQRIAAALNRDCVTVKLPETRKAL